MRKPILLGYQSAGLDPSPEHLINGQRILAAYAEREGYELADTYTDVPGSRGPVAFVALTSRLRRGGISAVAVPSLEHLGTNVHAQDLMTELITREGVRLLIAQVLASGPRSEAEAPRQNDGRRRRQT